MPRERERVVTGFVGEAGEHHVVSQLYREGYVAAQTGRGTAGIDVMAHSPDGRVRVDLQVKATTNRRRSWKVSETVERLSRPGLFYALVHFAPDSPAVTFIVPSTIVADYVSRAHRAWLERPGRGGRPHRPNPIRTIRDWPPDHWPPGHEPVEVGWLDRYRERWDTLAQMSPTR